MAKHTSTGRQSAVDTHDRIREYLTRKQCPTHVVQGGLRGLVEMWETIVTEVAHGYDLTFEDYLNDMDTRQLIDEVQPLASTAADKALLRKLNRLDAVMQTLLEPARNCLWGAATAREHHWKRSHHWWYFMQPKNPGTDLRDELETRIIADNRS